MPSSSGTKKHLVVAAPAWHCPPPTHQSTPAPPFSFLLHYHLPIPVLPSLPTRRSSDLRYSHSPICPENQTGRRSCSLQSCPHCCCSTAIVWLHLVNRKPLPEI